MEVKKAISRIIHSSALLEGLCEKCISLKNSHGGVTVCFKGGGRISRDVVGINNSILIKDGAIIHGSTVRIRGNDNRLVIGKNVRIGKRCSFWMEGNHIVIEVGDNTTFTRDIQLCAQEDGSSIRLGNDCMLSNTIIIRTSDSHSIYDENTGNRINMPGNVMIGDHVWIAPNSKIFKNVEVGTGSVIGSDTLVTKNIGCNCLAVGHPAKVVKENIRWSREKLF